GAWQRDVEAAGGRDAWSYTLLELADWSEWVLELLPSLRTASDAADEIGASVTGLRDLAHLHLLRQHVAELTEAQAAERAAQMAAAEAAAAAERAEAERAQVVASGGAHAAVATAEALLVALRRDGGGS
ncbi:MAG: hypothetical protein ACLGI8_10475, partial [Acidimicrobiia bacterium]